MQEKIREAQTWGKIHAIIGIVGSVFSMLSVVGIPMGVLALLAYLRLNRATDDLKALGAKEIQTAEDYQGVVEGYGAYMKLLTIGQIIGIALAVLTVGFCLILAMSFYGMMGGYRFDL